MTEKCAPSIETIGNECRYWNVLGENTGCGYSDNVINKRMSCEGLIDDICLYLGFDGDVDPKSLSYVRMVELKYDQPSIVDKSFIPAGDTQL